MKNDEIEEKLHELIVKWTNFMKWHPKYEKWVEDRIWQEKHQEERINSLKENFNSLLGKRILDLGCGMGGLTVALAKEKLDVIALDFNPDYCKITKLRGERYKLKVEIINSMGEYLPFRNESIDIVCLFDVLEHVQEPIKVLNETYRVLKPSGGAIVTFVNRYTLKDPHYHLLFINWMPGRLVEWYIKKEEEESSIFPYQTDRNYLICIISPIMNLKK
jgi:ubiquinone/menaquinone biosynthesis C-methylase UbiE